MSWRYRNIKRDIDLDTHLIVFFYTSLSATLQELDGVVALTEVSGFNNMPHGVANDCYIEIELARMLTGEEAWERLLDDDYSIAVIVATGDPERSVIPIEDIVYSNVYRAVAVRPRERKISVFTHEETVKFVAPHYYKSLGEQYPALSSPASIGTYVVADSLPLRKKSVRTGPFTLDVADTPDYPYLFGMLKRIPDNSVLTRVDGHIWGWAFDGFSPDGYPAYATLKFKYENLWIILDDKNGNSGVTAALEFKNTWELFGAYLELWDVALIPAGASFVPIFRTLEERQDLDVLDMEGYFHEHVITRKESEFTASQVTVAYNPVPAHKNVASEIAVNNPNGSTSSQLSVSVKTPWHHDFTFTETWDNASDDGDPMTIIIGATRPGADLHGFIRKTDDDELLAVHLLDSTDVVGTLSDGTEITANGDWIPYPEDITLTLARVVFWVARNGYSRVLAERLMLRHQNKSDKIEGILRGHWLHRVGTRCTVGSLLGEFTITRAEYEAENNTTKFIGELK